MTVREKGVMELQLILQGISLQVEQVDNLLWVGIGRKNTFH